MYHFIVNPNARSGLGAEVWSAIEKMLNFKKIDYQVYFTKYQRHATKIAASITSDGAQHTIVALGGDGTIGEVVTGLTYPEKITLGYIPIGSGNDFARGLGLPKDAMEALNCILTSTNHQKLNLGCLTYPNKKRRFAVSSGIGYDAAICHKVCVSKLKKFLNKLKLGKLAYVGLSLHSLYHTTPKESTIILDDEKELHFDRTYFVTAMNLPYEGGGCMFCPDASPEDDFLDLIVIADIPKIGALPILATVYSGKHTKMPGVHIYRCKKAEVKSPVPLPVHSDGEPIFLQRNVIFSVEDASPKIILPEK